MTRILFVLKHRDAPWDDYSAGTGLSSGLHNSVRFIAEMLESLGIGAKAASPVDVRSMVDAMAGALGAPRRGRALRQRQDLLGYCRRTERAWLKRLGVHAYA